MRSFTSFLILASLTYLALSQSQCTTAPSGCQFCAQTGFANANTCTQCNTGFLLTNTMSSCTALAAGCWWGVNATSCTTAMPGYVLNAGVPVSCSTATTGITGSAANCATCTISGTVLTCTACAAGYAWGNSTCVSCSAASTATPTSTVLGITGCSACTFSATVGATPTNTIAGNWVGCTACSSGFVFMPLDANNINGMATCVNLATPVASATSGAAVDGNGIVTASFTGASGVAGVTIGTFDNTATPKYPVATITAVNSGSWCTITTGVVTCTTAALSGATGIPTNCLGGSYTGTTPSCLLCNSTVSYLSGTGSTATCTTLPTNCLAAWSNGTCYSVSPGFTLTSTNTIVACGAAGGIGCLGGAGTGNYLLSNGSVATGTGITNCWYHNSTSNCVMCAGGYATSVPNCTACPANCNNCSSATTCTGCAPTYTLSTNGSCTASCPVNQTRNANGTCTFSKNMIASGLAFISMVFYYIF